MPELDYTILMICMVVTTQDELQKAFQIRTEVFVNEQHVPIHLEMDALDKVAIHVLCTENSEAIGCGRIILDGSTAWIGRVAVKKNWRNKGFGRELMLKMMAIAFEKGATTISLHAQLPVVEFYQKLGFSAHGETFMDAGIEHIEMNLRLSKTYYRLSSFERREEMKDKLISSIQDPRLLERLYQEDPDGFIAAFQEVFPDHPDSLVLQCWQERLSYVPNAKESVVQRNEKPWIMILLTTLFILAGGFIYKIAGWLPDKYAYNIADMFHFRNAGAYFLPFMAFLYLIHTKAKKKTIWMVIVLILISAVYINLLPNVVFEGKIGSYSDTLLLACFHIPLLYWFAGGFAYVGFPFRSIQRRLEFLKMNSEILFMTTLILLAGVVLTGISLASFGILDVDAGEIFFDWIIPFGAIGSPIVATVLVLKTVKLHNLPPLLAKIFAPLFLITVLVFLSLMLLKIKNPFEDRDFLIVINILLFIIMSLTTFILLDRKPHLPRNIMDIIVASLLVSCFLIDIVTVVSVLFRVVEEGFTPNRIALIGINLVLLVHLTGLLVNFAGWLVKKIEYQKTVGWIGGYLPVYLGWSVFMVFVYPWIFRLR